MKMKKKLLNGCIAFACILGCILSLLYIPDNVDAKAVPRKLVMNKSRIVIEVGSKYKLKVKKTVPSKADKKVKYKSANKKIARVSSKGVVKGLKKGKTKIKVISKRNKKIRAIVKVTVRKKADVNMPVSTTAPVNVSEVPLQNTDNPAVNTSTPLPSVEPIYNPDYAKLVGRSDLTYEGLVTFSPYGMPVANGRFGGPVWEADENTLAMQLNHTDTFMFNDASANSEWDYRSGALGVLNIDFGNAVFSDELSQHLSLYDGKLSLTDKEVSVNVIADNASDAVLINIDDKRKNPSDINIDLKMTRNPIETKGKWSAISSFDIDTADNLIMLNQIFSEECDTGISTNDFYCATSVSMEVTGKDTSVSSINNQTARITVPAGAGSFTIVIGGCSSLDKSVDVVNTAYSNCMDSQGYDKVYESNKEWWKDYWSKSYVYLPSQPDFEKRRTYYMYLAGISNRGNYPSKYNGGNWIAEGDRRDWGNWYWNWNQDSLYQPLNSANHMELMQPLYIMREKCYNQYKVAAKQYWGIDSDDALFIGETSGVLGAETLPDSIVPELQKYLAGTGELTDSVREMGEKRNRFLVPWNWKFSSEPENNSVSYVSHTMVATQETAEYYWQKYEYTKDVDWLRNHAYKFIKGAAELYRNYDGFIKEDDGYYHFYRTNLHEHIWGGKDVIDDLSLARGIFAVAVKASEILGVDSELRKEWQDCLDNIAPYPQSDDEGAIGFTVDNRSGNTTWAQGLQPASLIRALEGTESPQFKMLEKFDVLNMETRDQKKDNGDFQIALNTFYDTPGYKNQFLNGEEDKNGSSRFLEDAAKLGRADELEVMFYSQYKAFFDNPNLLHDQGDYYSAEGYGTWSAAIQTALNQSLAPLPGEDTVIRVFPAWPTSWDAKYKLLAKGGFLVSSSMVDGDIQYVEITSQIGGTCRIRNPWDSDIDIYRCGVKSETVPAGNNDLLSFETAAGEDIVLVRKNDSPDKYRTAVVE